MSNKKKSDVFSFKAISEANSSAGSLAQSRGLQEQALIIKQLPTMNFSGFPDYKYSNNLKSGIYRHNRSQEQKYQPQLKLQTQNVLRNFQKSKHHHLEIHPKINNLQIEIEQNLRKRLQLQQDLDRLKNIEKNSLAQRNFYQAAESFKDQAQLQKQFSIRAKETSLLNTLSQSKKTIPKSQQLDENIKILTGMNLNDTIKNVYAQKNIKGMTLDDFLKVDNSSKDLQKSKNSKNSKAVVGVHLQPNFMKVQQLLNQVTFPQIPQKNLQQLYKKCSSLYAIHKPHSDIIYLMMVINFHLGNFEEVKKYFKEIILFKKFEKKIYWVMAQTQFFLQEYQNCIKFTQNCINELQDRFLPRFLYLKAKSYNEIGSFTNSIVCYNQLIRIKSSIPQYYLQRAILYDKLGYIKECREDYLMFGILKPDAKEYLQQKILMENNDAKRKELLEIYKKLI